MELLATRSGRTARAGADPWKSRRAEIRCAFGFEPLISSLARVAHRDTGSDIPQPVSDWRIVPPERVG
jgi:hypothetical protein